MREPIPFKYRAFLSYSHGDKIWAKWLHRALEAYRIDTDLVGKPTPIGTVPKNLRPIFRDREDFSAGHSLSEQTLAALQSSQFLIILCSPTAAKSPHVNEEVRRFKVMGGSQRLIPIIIDGEPGDPDRECFPEALRFKLDENGVVTKEIEEPLAADARPGRDGRENAKQKVVAGLLGVSLDEIARRSERARKRRLTIWAGLAGAFLILSVVATSSAVYAYKKLLQSDDRLDQAIGIAYKLIARATEMTNQLGVPSELIFDLLNDADSALNDLISKGANSDLLRYRKSLMLISFSQSYARIGQTALGLQRASEAKDILDSLVASQIKPRDLNFSRLQAQLQIGELLFFKQQLRSALENLRFGLDIGRELLKVEPDRLEVFFYVVQCNIDIGNAFFSLGLFSDSSARFAEAWNDIQSYQKSSSNTFTPASHQGAPNLQPLSTAVSDRMAQLNAMRGLIQLALEYHKSTLAYREELSQQNPQSLYLRSAALESQFQVANLLLYSGSVDDAEYNFRHGLLSSESLSKSDPKNVGYKQFIALFRDGLGRILLTRGNASEAVVAFQVNLDSAKTFIESDSGNLLWQGLLGVGYEHIGDALMMMGAFSAAVAEYQAEHSLLSALIKSSPEDAEWQTRLAGSSFKIGDALLAQGLRDPAKDSFEQSLPIRANQTSENPGYVAYRAYLLQTQWRLAQLRGDANELEKDQIELEKLKADGVIGEEGERWLSYAEADFSKLGMDTLLFWKDCESAVATRAIAGCSQIINSGNKSAAIQAIAYNFRGDAYENAGQVTLAIADYDQAVRLDPQSAVGFSNRAEAYRRSNQIDRSIIDFDQALLMDPDNPIIHNNRGLAYSDNGQFDVALEDFNEAIRLRPAFSIAYANRGFAFGKIGKLDQAFEDLSKAIQIDPKNAMSFSVRGDVRRLRNQFDDAIADYDQAIKLNPNTASSYNGRALAYENENRLEPALADLNAAIHLDPNLAFAYANRGDVLRLRGEYDRAIVDYNESLRIDPTNAGSYNARALAFEHKAQIDLALSDLDRAIRLSPNFALAYSNRGFVLGEKGQFDEAIVDLTAAIKFDPTMAIAYSNRGDVLRLQHKEDEAISDYDEAIKLNPSDVPSYRGRALAYVDQGQLSRAISDYTTAIRLSPYSSELYNFRGVALLKATELNKAFDDFSTAIRLDPKNAIAHTNLGRVYELRGQFDQALAEHTAALQLNPKLAVAYANMGLAYEGKGDRTKALSEFEAALAIDPTLQRAIEGRARISALH